MARKPDTIKVRINVGQGDCLFGSVDIEHTAMLGDFSEEARELFIEEVNRKIRLTWDFTRDSERKLVECTAEQ